VIRFLGPLVETDKLRVGIELDEPLGKHNGTPKGTNNPYFVCAKKHGLLVPPGKVQLDSGGETFAGFDDGGAAGTSSSSATHLSSKCAQKTSTGPCKNDALPWSALCSDHTCMHPGCSSRKSSKDQFCKQHAAPPVTMTLEGAADLDGGEDAGMFL
jgi:hypothetical protein